jgi:hypothetical protein
MWRFLPSELPAEIEGRDTYYQMGVKILSLTCKGPVVVRSVFKMHNGSDISYAGTNCSTVSGSGNDSAVIRCELQLPATGGIEAERALHGKEVRCWQCGLCSEGKGCPNRYGVWYSDTFTTVGKGCDLTSYDARTLGFFINPDTNVLLAEFEACNTPGCFNASYEQSRGLPSRA